MLFELIVLKKQIKFAGDSMQNMKNEEPMDVTSIGSYNILE